MADHAHAQGAAGLAHQFDSIEQQREAVTLGMWAFLVQEIMFFGGLFLGYAVYRAMYPQAWAEASHHLDVLLGGVNTVILIGSSLTMALAVHAAHEGKRGWAILQMLFTMALGLAFLGIKVVEYSAKFAHHLVPGPHFHFEGAQAQPAQIFYSFYFAMTGMHALHMIIGVAVLVWLIASSAKAVLHPSHASRVEMFGLYWHFVDIVWIFLFPLLYLVSRHA